jgi:hypothetical protein
VDFHNDQLLFLNRPCDIPSLIIAYLLTSVNENDYTPRSLAAADLAEAATMSCALLTGI